MLKFHLTQMGSRVDAHFDDEPAVRNRLLSAFLNDMYDQEDYYLSELARAEAGEMVTDLYNHAIHVYPYRDVVVLEDMSDPTVLDNAAEGPRGCTFLTPSEAKQLILDWLDAKKKWREDQQQR